MKITKTQLKQIIKEELEAVTEVGQDPMEVFSPDFALGNAIYMLKGELEMQESYPDEYQSGTVQKVIWELEKIPHEDLEAQHLASEREKLR